MCCEYWKTKFIAHKRALTQIFYSEIDTYFFSFTETIEKQFLETIKLFSYFILSADSH